MSETILRVEKLTNGYTVEVCDPAVLKKNRTSKGVYASPWKEYAFKTPKETLAFLTKILPTLTPEADDAGKAFNEACASEEE